VVICQLIHNKLYCSKIYLSSCGCNSKAKLFLNLVFCFADIGSSSGTSKASVYAHLSVTWHFTTECSSCWAV